MSLDFDDYSSEVTETTASSEILSPVHPEDSRSIQSKRETHHEEHSKPLMADSGAGFSGHVGQA